MAVEGDGRVIKIDKIMEGKGVGSELQLSFINHKLDKKYQIGILECSKVVQERSYFRVGISFHLPALTP